jgi:hypothetical protein
MTFKLSFIALATLLASAQTPLAPVVKNGPLTATIYVYRSKAKIVGAMLRPSVYYDGTELYRLDTGTFFTAKLPIGKHMITIGRSEVGLLMDLEPGKDYYFAFGHRSVWAGAVGVQPIFLSLVSEDKARADMQGLRGLGISKRCNSCGDR